MFRTFQVCKQEKKKSVQTFDQQMAASAQTMELLAWRRETTEITEGNKKKLISQVLNTKENITVSAVEKNDLQYIIQKSFWPP